jgi:hypothetical protein
MFSKVSTIQKQKRLWKKIISNTKYTHDRILRKLQRHGKSNCGKFLFGHFLLLLVQKSLKAAIFFPNYTRTNTPFEKKKCPFGSPGAPLPMNKKNAQTEM